MPLMTWPDLMSRPRPHASERIGYGTDPNQFADLWRPDGAGPHPLVVMIHGGCWQAKVANLGIMDWAADDLRQRGYTVWNVEYRRIDQPGGGYPGTYDDIRSALWLAGERLGGAHVPVVILGHSAGGHLALWAAHQKGLNATGVVALGAITDLIGDTETACGTEPLQKMLGPPAETSPYQMGSLDLPTVLITGAEDTTVPASIAHRYAAMARAAGDRVEVLTPPGGHVEEIAPGTEAWRVVVEAIERLARP